jgi:formamidopyrimidine-DNA glycosylase
MAELPEIERYRIILSEHFVGKQITEVEVNREKSVNKPIEQFIMDVRGQNIIDITRRAKYLIFDLSAGNSLLLHLMIGGWLFIGTENIFPKPTKQIIVSLGETKLYFVGLRLGYLHLVTKKELNLILAKLGPEPFDPTFTFDRFQERITRKRGTLKSILIDPTFISGIGTCYSDEICYSARLLPFKKAQELTEKQIYALFHAIKPVLLDAIEKGGYMDFPLYANDEKTGGYNDHFLVYLCENRPCKRCGAIIEKTAISSRKSYYCPGCQE